MVFSLLSLMKRGSSNQSMISTVLEQMLFKLLLISCYWFNHLSVIVTVVFTSIALPHNYSLVISTDWILNRDALVNSCCSPSTSRFYGLCILRYTLDMNDISYFILCHTASHKTLVLLSYFIYFVLCFVSLCLGVQRSFKGKVLKTRNTCQW